MRWLKAVIARLTGRQVPPVSNTASQTEIAGHARPEPTTQTGSHSFAQATKPHRQPRSHAQAPSSKKPKAAKPTTLARKSSSKKQSAVLMVESQSTTGSSTQTPARKTRQHAKPVRKQKP